MGNRYETFIGKAHERLHKNDNVSKVPDEILTKAYQSAGFTRGIHGFGKWIFRRVGYFRAVEDVKEFVSVIVNSRIDANVDRLPEDVQPRVDEVKQFVSAIICKEGFFTNGAIEYASAALVNHREAERTADLMIRFGLVEVFSRKRGGETWKLSKKIDPALQYVDN